MNKENDEKLMIFDVFIDTDTQSQFKNLGISRIELWTCFSKVLRLLSLTPVEIVIHSNILVQYCIPYSDSFHWKPIVRDSTWVIRNQSRFSALLYITRLKKFNPHYSSNRTFDGLMDMN